MSLNRFFGDPGPVLRNRQTYARDVQSKWSSTWEWVVVVVVESVRGKREGGGVVFVQK